MNRAEAAKAIIAAGKNLGALGLAPATSGNYSIRLKDDTIAITVSGTHKAHLTEADIMTVDASGKPLENKKPSAETLLHTQIYQLNPAVNAILHVHSIPGTVFTRISHADDIILSGYEMLKAFPGVDTHETTVTVPIFNNSQDMNVLANEVSKKIRKDIPAYIIRDHGFYVWGRDMPETERIAEGLEYLLSCEVEILKIKAGVTA